MLNVAFELCFSVHLLPAILRSSSASLLRSVSYLRVLASIVFPLSLCTQPPYFRGGRSARDATPFRLVYMEEDSSTFGFFVYSSGVSFVYWDSRLYF